MIDPDEPPARRKASSPRIGWALWERSYAEWHTVWAARERRTRAGREQYGQKMVWVLSHRYTKPGLRASLLKGRDRELVRLLLDEPHGEACYLARLQIREVGSARAAEGASWGDDTIAWLELEDEPDDDPAPASMRRASWLERQTHDPAPDKVVHRETPELHLDGVARQNVWIEGLRSLSGKDIDHGPIEVLDGEIVPPEALSHAVPDGARLYEATGNEGASLELQYRCAVLVMWRRNEATLRMLARCGGRLALAVELAQRSTAEASEGSYGKDLSEVLAQWTEALVTDGGGPEPRAHRLVLDAIAREQDSGTDERLRERYVERVAAVDLEAEAVPTLVNWIRDRLQSGESMDRWLRALSSACGKTWTRGAMSGAPALLRALCEKPETKALAIELLADRHDPPKTSEAVLRHADTLDEALAEQAWKGRRIAKMTMDNAEAWGEYGA